MSKCVKIPVGVNVYGGTATVEGDEHKRQLITLALSSGESANAFQQEVNLGQEMIFGRDSSSLRSSVTQRLLTIFADFENNKLFRLMRETISWAPGKDGELTLSFDYIDMESDTVLSFRKPYSVGA